MQTENGKLCLIYAISPAMLFWNTGKGKAIPVTGHEGP
jgi:hypothetical protein